MWEELNWEKSLIFVLFHHTDKAGDGCLDGFEKGNCQAENEEGQWMRDNCKKTCDLCTCSDEYFFKPICQLKGSKYCKKDSPFRPWMLEHCRLD